MKLSDYAGEVRISSNDAKNFVQSWFKADDKICISGLRSERTGSMDAVSQSMTAREFVSTTDDQSLQDTVFGEDGSKWNIYIQVCPIKEDVTLKQRGTKSNVDYVPGVWADLDVKEGGFSSQKEILKWLNELDLLPTVICSSGSSGVHAYWKLRWDEKGNETLVDSWWSYLDEMAGERKIDKLIDITRILRLPGTVRFPKKEETSGKLGSVSIISIYPERRYSVSQIQEVSADAMARKAAERKQLIQREAERRVSVDELARSITGATNRWGLLQAVAHIEDYVNDNWDWAHILEPHGWKYRRTLSDGSKEWARPGQSDRSAVVDFEGSPVMSLLSMSESTGLADLQDARIPLTRYRVLLRLWYNDDENKLVQDLMEKMQNGEIGN